MEMTQWVGIGAGIMTAFSMLPQLIKVIKEKKAEDISIVMVLVLIGGLIMWIVYGILKEDWPLIITNSFSVLVNSLLLIFRIKYNGTKEST